MKNIGLIGLNKVKNIGDPILYKSAEFLIHKVKSDDQEIINIDINGTESSFLDRVLSKLLTLLILSLELFSLKETKLMITLKMLRKKLGHGSYYKKMLQDQDMLIFAGGGLIKYTFEEWYLKIPLIIEYATKMNPDIKIYFNAVGVEGYSETDVRCQHLKKWLNNPSVKCVTTRDDIDTLENKYIDNPTIITKLVADSAFWVDEVYKSDIKNNGETPKAIGLGVARSKIFIDHGIDFSKDQIIEFWIEMVKELDNRSIIWEFYTNGSDTDNAMLEEVMNHSYFQGRKITYFIPKDDIDFINITNSFSKIFATRMHASIVGYALNKPTHGLIWNVKVAHFSKLIGHENRYYNIDELNINTIVDRLVESEYLNSDTERKQSFRKSTLESLSDFVN